MTKINSNKTKIDALIPIIARQFEIHHGLTNSCKYEMKDNRCYSAYLNFGGFKIRLSDHRSERCYSDIHLMICVIANNDEQIVVVDICNNRLLELYEIKDLGKVVIEKYKSYLKLINDSNYISRINRYDKFADRIAKTCPTYCKTDDKVKKYFKDKFEGKSFSNVELFKIIVKISNHLYNKSIKDPSINTLNNLLNEYTVKLANKKR